LEEVLGLVDLRGVLSTGLAINQVTNNVDSLRDLRFVAVHRVFDLFDDVHATSFLSWAAERIPAAPLLCRNTCDFAHASTYKTCPSAGFAAGFEAPFGYDGRVERQCLR
jgi:hypothetical protein